MNAPAARASWVPVLVAFAANRAVLAAAAALSGASPFAAASLCRWDTVFYLDIAASGYHPIVHCPPESGYAATAWCGNTGWFPGYPWAIALVARSGLALASAAVAIAAVAQLASLRLVWILLGERRRPLLLALAAFFPGAVYMAAAFPVSLLVLCLLACLRGCDRARFGAASAAAAAASTLYPTGALLGPVVALWALLARRPKALWVCVASVAGLVAVAVVLHREAGAFDAFFKVQAHYGYGSGNALDTFFARFKPLVNPRYRDAKGVVSALQTVLTLAIVGAVVSGWRRLVASPSGTLLLIMTLAWWAVPIALGGKLSLYRSEALLLPAVLALPPLSARALAGLTASAVAITGAMAVLFFRGVLV